MTVVRWVLTHPATSETWTMPINPNQADSPFQKKEVKTAHGTRAGLDRIRLFQTASAPTEWNFGGVIRTKSHYDDLVHWAKKTDEVRVSDHLGRTFEVIIKQFAPVDRPPTGSTPWRLTYKMTCLVLRRIA